MSTGVYKTPNGTRITLAEMGVTWLSESRIAELGLVEVDEDYVTPSSLDELKTKKWIEIKAARDAEEQAGFVFKDKILDSDEKSSLRITAAVTAAQAAVYSGIQFSLDWTCKDNTVLSLTAQEVCEMGLALAQHSNDVHEKARVLRDKIESATITEEIVAVVW